MSKYTKGPQGSWSMGSSKDTPEKDYLRFGREPKEFNSPQLWLIALVREKHMSQPYRQATALLKTLSNKEIITAYIELYSYLGESDIFNPDNNYQANMVEILLLIPIKIATNIFKDSKKAIEIVQSVNDPIFEGIYKGYVLAQHGA
jgi:hypothetical protein